MPEYRRADIPGGIYFLTLVTYQRHRWFVDASNVRYLKRAIREVRRAHPFGIWAGVILPDHIHFLWELPPADHDFSTRIGKIKVLFTKSLTDMARHDGMQSLSRQRHREAAVWQRRFWEHCIRDDEDFSRHMDYIHYNPVKHEYVPCPHDWSHSSFAYWVRKKRYDSDWACSCRRTNAVIPKFENMEATVGE